MSLGLSRRQLLLGAAGTALLGGPACATEGVSSGPDGYQLTSQALQLPTLHPAHEGLKIAQLSDIHIGVETPDERVLSAVRAVNAEKPDVIFLTGDYTTFLREPIERIPALLGGLEAPVYAVLGNHDHDVDAPMVKTWLEKTGFSVLQNQWTEVRIKGAAFNIFGVDDGFTKHADVRATLKGAPTDGSRLVLAHSPPTVRDLPHGANLACFSGHTHGGSVVIPGITDLVSTMWGQPYTRGYYQVNGNQLYVNRGLGFGVPGKLYAPRVNSPPEAALFTLQRGTGQALLSLKGK